MRKALFTLLALAVCCCAPTGKGGAPSTRQFPAVEVPTVYQDRDEIVDYVLEHYWDGFFGGTGVSDTSALLGVKKPDLEQALANFIGLLPNAPMPRAQKAVRHLFDQISACEMADTSHHVYARMTEMVADYLYDPNSPLRNEDYFLPFVKALAESPLTGEEWRPGYEYQARMCSLNQFGQPVPDFKFKDKKGRVHSLYEVNAAYTMLFFSNPGCHACKGIIDEVMSRPYMESYLANRLVAVVNVYIDEDIRSWKEYEHNYPESWLSGYDFKSAIRNSQLYDVRAIPSLYLLDADKKVVLKDAPTEKVLEILDNL